MRRRPDPEPDRGAAPDVLADPSAPVWHDPETFVGWLADRGYVPTATEAAETVPERRRRAAVVRWAVGAGVTAAHHPAFPDWHRLKTLGLT